MERLKGGTKLTVHERTALVEARKRYRAGLTFESLTRGEIFSRLVGYTPQGRIVAIDKIIAESDAREEADGG